MIHRTLDLQRVPPRARVGAIAEVVAELPLGELVEVLTSEPRSVPEFRASIVSARTDLLESSRLGDVFRFVLRKR
jgi:TusA-related sulfurtransferase